MLPNRMNEVVRSILSGGVAALVATAATIAALTAVSVNTTTLSATNSTSTTMAVSTLRVNQTNGFISDGKFRATQVVNVNSLGAGQTTTTDVALTGVVAGDHCSVATTAGDLWGTTTSTASLSCRPGTDLVTVTIRNATGTSSFDAGASSLSVLVESAQ